MAKQGRITIITGNVGSDRVHELAKVVDELRQTESEVLIFKPDVFRGVNKRSLKMSNGDSLKAIYVDSRLDDKAFQEITERIGDDRANVVVFDEVQFFLRGRSFKLIDSLLNKGHDIIASGLELNFRGEPFSSTLELIGLCCQHRLIRLFAECAVDGCTKPGIIPQRLIRNEKGFWRPAAYKDAVIHHADRECRYEPRCRTHFDMPGGN